MAEKLGISREEIDAACALGIDCGAIRTWRRYGWVATELSEAPLPPHWNAHRSRSGSTLYLTPDGETVTEHPLLSDFQEVLALVQDREELNEHMRTVIQSFRRIDAQRSGKPALATWALKQVCKGPKGESPVEPHEVLEMAKYMKIHPVDERDLAWVALWAVHLPLPHGWEEWVDGDAKPFYYCTKTNVSTYDHPLDDLLAQLLHDQRNQMTLRRARVAGRSLMGARGGSSSTSRLLGGAASGGGGSSSHQNMNWDHDGGILPFFDERGHVYFTDVFIPETAETSADQQHTRKGYSAGVAVFQRAAKRIQASFRRASRAGSLATSRMSTGNSGALWDSQQKSPPSKGHVVGAAPQTAPSSSSLTQTNTQKANGTRVATAPTGRKASLLQQPPLAGHGRASQDHTRAHSRQGSDGSHADGNGNSGQSNSLLAELTDVDPNDADADTETARSRATRDGKLSAVDEAAVAKHAHDIIERIEWRLKKGEVEPMDHDEEGLSNRRVVLTKYGPAEILPVDHDPGTPQRVHGVGRGRDVGKDGDHHHDERERDHREKNGAGGLVSGSGGGAGTGTGAGASKPPRVPTPSSMSKAATPRKAPAPAPVSTRGTGSDAAAHPSSSAAAGAAGRALAWRLGIRWRLFAAQREVTWARMVRDFHAGMATRIQCVWKGYRQRRLFRMVRGEIADRRRRRKVIESRLASRIASRRTSETGDGGGGGGGSAKKKKNGGAGKEEKEHGEEKVVVVEEEDADVAAADAADHDALQALKEEEDDGEDLLTKMKRLLARRFFGPSETFAAVRVQRAVRGWLARARYPRLRDLQTERLALLDRVETMFTSMYALPDAPQTPDGSTPNSSRSNRVSHDGVAGGGTVRGPPPLVAHSPAWVARLGAALRLDLSCGLSPDVGAETTKNLKLRRGLAHLERLSEARARERAALEARWQVLERWILPRPSTTSSTSMSATTARTSSTTPSSSSSSSSPSSLLSQLPSRLAHVPAREEPLGLSGAALRALRGRCGWVIETIAGNESRLCDATIVAKEEVIRRFNECHTPVTFPRRYAVMRMAPSVTTVSALVEDTLLLRALAVRLAPIQNRLGAWRAVSELLGALASRVRYCQEASDLAEQLADGAEASVALQRASTAHLHALRDAAGGWAILAAGVATAVATAQEVVLALPEVTKPRLGGGGTKSTKSTKSTMSTAAPGPDGVSTSTASRSMMIPGPTQEGSEAWVANGAGTSAGQVLVGDRSRGVAVLTRTRSMEKSSTDTSMSASTTDSGHAGVSAESLARPWGSSLRDFVGIPEDDDLQSTLSHAQALWEAAAEHESNHASLLRELEQTIQDAGGEEGQRRALASRLGTSTSTRALGAWAADIVPTKSVLPLPLLEALSMIAYLMRGTAAGETMQRALQPFMRAETPLGRGLISAGGSLAGDGPPWMPTWDEGEEGEEGPGEEKIRVDGEGPEEKDANPQNPQEEEEEGYLGLEMDAAEAAAVGAAVIGAALGGSRDLAAEAEAAATPRRGQRPSASRGAGRTDSAGRIRSGSGTEAGAEAEAEAEAASPGPSLVMVKNRHTRAASQWAAATVAMRAARGVVGSVPTSPSGLVIHESVKRMASSKRS